MAEPRPLDRLRGLFYEDPSAHNWHKITALLEQWPDETLALGAAYAAEHLSTWPDSLRKVPLPWLGFLWGGKRKRKKRTLSQKRQKALIKHALPLTRGVEWARATWGYKEFRLLDQCPTLAPHLTHLSLPEHRDTVGLLTGLEEASGLVSLRHLSMRNPLDGWAEYRPYKSRVLRAFNNPLLHHLESLELSGLRLEEHAVMSLLLSLPSLSHVAFGFNDLSMSFCETFARHTWPLLRSLDLNLNPVGLSQAGEFFFASPEILPHLETLNLSGTRLRTEALTSMTQGEAWETLHTLHLSNNRSLRGFTLLPSLIARLPVLETLSLSWCELGDDDAAVLQEISWPKTLRHLDLRHNALSTQAQHELQDVLGDRVDPSAQHIHQDEAENHHSMDILPIYNRLDR